MDTKFLWPYSDSSMAFTKEENDGTNMLLLDFGERIGQRLEETKTLDGVKRVIAFGTHIHRDHISGVQQLKHACEKSGAKLMFLMPDIKRQRRQLYTALITLGMKHIKEISADEVADMLNLQSIDFEAIDHNPMNPSALGDKYARVDTTALIMQTKEQDERNKIVYAADNNDKPFVKSVLRDKALKELFLDMTFKKHGLGVHFTLKKIEKIANAFELGAEDRQRIIGMHFLSKDLPAKVKEAGFGVATDRMVQAEGLEPTTYSV